MYIVKTQSIQNEWGRARAHTYTHTPAAYQGNGTEEKVFKKKGFQGRFKRADRGRVADRKRKLVPDNWSLVRERTGFTSEGWYSEHSGASRRAELPGRCVKVVLKGRWKPGEK